MVSTIIIFLFLLLALIILISLGVFTYIRIILIIVEREKTEKRLETIGEIILNVLGSLKETDTDDEAFKNSSLIYGFNLIPWNDEESGMEVLGIGALVSDIGQIQVKVAVTSGTKQYVISSEGTKPYQNFFDKTNEGDVSEKGLIDVIQCYYGLAIEKNGYHQVEMEKDEDEKLIDPVDFFEINR